MSSISLISFWFLQFWSSAEQNRKERPSFFEVSPVFKRSALFDLFQDRLRVVLFFQFGFLSRIISELFSFFQFGFLSNISFQKFRFDALHPNHFFHGHICFQIVYADIQKTNPVRIFEQQTWTFLIIRHFFEIWICFRTQTLYLRLSFVALFGWSAFFLTRFFRACNLTKI